MTARAVRAVVLAVCAVGIASMIVASIAERSGAALAAGLVTAAAVACLMVATAVAGPGPGAPPDEEQAQRVEQLADELVAGGSEAPLVRALVREAVRLGRGLAQRGGRPGPGVRRQDELPE